MSRGISDPPDENPAIPVRTCGCAAVFVRAFARKQAPCAGRTGFAQDSSLEGDGFEPSVPREGVKGQGPQFHADYPPIGWARKQRMKRMLNGFKRYGITCPAQMRCQP